MYDIESKHTPILGGMSFIIKYINGVINDIINRLRKNHNGPSAG